MLAFAPRPEDPHAMPLTLIDAAESADVQTVRELLDGGADVNAATSNGMTALMCAAGNGRLKILLMLLGAGADVNKVRNDGVTALALAAFFGHRQVVQELISRGANVEAPRLHNSLENWARARGFPEVTQLLQDARGSKMIPLEEPGLDPVEKPNAVVVPVSERSRERGFADDSGIQLHLADELEWLEFSDTSIVDTAELSPASVWAPEFEKEITLRKKLDHRALEQSQAEGIEQLETNDETGLSDTNNLSVDWREFEEPASEDNPADYLLRESGSLQDELSFTRSTLDRELDFFTAQGKAAASEADVDDRGVNPRVLILDESQVLSGEASFATVVLNQPIEAAPKNKWEHVNSASEELTASEAGRRVRLLNESQEEAYLDALLVNHGIASPRYSPIAEFFARSNLNWARLAMAGLLLVTTSIVATVFLVRITEAVISSMPPVTTTMEDSSPTQPDNVQTELTVSESPDPTPSSQKEVSTPLTSTTAEAAKPVAASAAQHKFAERVSVEGSRPALPEKAKSENLRKPAEQKSKPLSSRVAHAVDSSKRVPSAQPKHASAKGTAVIKKTRSTETVSRSEPLLRRQELPPAAQPKAESKSTLASGGGIRPRRAKG